MLKKICTNCGVNLKNAEWGPNRACPICGMPTVNVDIKEVHVFFGDTPNYEHFIKNDTLDAPLQRNRNEKHLHSGINYHSVHLYYELCIGNINNPPYSNSNYYAHCYSSYKTALMRKEKAFEKLDSVDNTTPIYLWLNDKDTNEHLNLLYFADSFERFENIFLVRVNHTEKNFNDTESTMIDALEKKVKLSAKDLHRFSARFNEIQSWNAECLMGDSDTVEAWPLSKIGSFVLSCMSSEYKSFGKIYSDVFDLIQKETGYHTSYNMVTEAVYHLMMIGKIKSHGACMWWGESCYNNMLSTQSFCIQNRRPTLYTYTDTIEIVCDAFEFGYTYPLYDFLSDTSTLVKGGQTITGKRSIIEYIENDGVYRIHVCKQNVICNIAGTKEDGSFHKNGTCILLCYEKEESCDYWHIRISFDNNIINCIELSNPQEETEQT